MIASFADSETRKISEGHYSRRFPPSIQARARLCLERIAAAKHPADLAVFPALRLKRLKGPQSHIFSIRVNRQYRICFEWLDGRAERVQLLDYH